MNAPPGPAYVHQRSLNGDQSSMHGPGLYDDMDGTNAPTSLPNGPEADGMCTNDLAA